MSTLIVTSPSLCMSGSLEVCMIVAMASVCPGSINHDHRRARTFSSALAYSGVNAGRCTAGVRALAVVADSLSGYSTLPFTHAQLVHYTETGSSFHTVHPSRPKFHVQQ